MGHDFTPKTKHIIDSVADDIPLPAFLIVAAVCCVFLLLFTLGYAGYLQLQQIEAYFWESISFSLFGFMLPAINLYSHSYIRPSSSWHLRLTHPFYLSTIRV